VFLALVRALNERDLDGLLELTLPDVLLRPLAPCLQSEYRGHVWPSNCITAICAATSATKCWRSGRCACDAEPTPS
jgi:hypothetical protein